MMGVVSTPSLLVRAQEAQPRMLADLATLVAAESPSTDLAALDRCAQVVTDIAAHWLPRRPQLLTVDGRPHLLWDDPDAKVLLLGHFDTVWPLGTLTGWPFTIQDGIARGPGVFDMKAGLTLAFAAASLLDGLDGVSILLTSDEEIGSDTSRGLIEAHAVRAGAVLVCEPSADGGAVKIGRKGIAEYILTAHGRAAHAGLEPHRGINATIEIAHQILAVAALARPDAGTTVTPTVLAGGTTTNTVPETASVRLDVRAWTLAEIDRVDRALATAKPRLPGAVVAVDGRVNRAPFEPTAATGLYQLARQAARDAGLPEPDGVRSGGASDGNLTAGLGIPTLDGLGAIGGHPHGRDEHIQIDTLPERAALLAGLITLIRNRDNGREA